ncbi:oxaloacetate decarboxylase subunit alpha [Caloramator sp. ALD01]|uniref:oxaloacetate decarboxylase subunit alpha n=1 Tax=Caloramator sp. ALD01 TaxID=1031288 RepID=UPI00040E4641|nr:oxaloacetate decarboxylase subunit alpha [Caloramator sp. ALD01]
MRVNITETILRDANQSLIATRLSYKEFEAALELLDSAGYYSLEAWGGATFDSCLRFLNEDPWERLRNIRKRVKNTKLQMLLRGQNLLGYKHYPDDVVREFVKRAIYNGIDIIRIFDALNDFRNIEVCVDEVIKQGGHAQGTIAYTISPIHNTENYIKLAKELESMGVHSICIKDMAGIMGPKDAYELVSALKRTVNLPIVLHTHSTTGLAPMTYLKAVEAGVDCIDTAISSFSGGTSQPATESIHYALKDLGYETGLNEKTLKEINDHFKKVKDKYVESGQLNPFVLGTDTDALVYQVPGGMLSNLISQLKEQRALHKLDEVLSEVPRVREDLGYPPLVTPMSQMVGTQAALNVLQGERYKIVLKEVKAYIKGEYGKAPGTINEELIKKVLGDEKPLTIRFADTLEPVFEKTKEDIKEFAKTDEDVLSYLLFPQVAEKFLREKYSDKPKERTISFTIEAV